MKDLLGNILQIDDIVCFAPAKSYAGVSIGKIVKMTPKMIKIEIFPNQNYVSYGNDHYLCYPSQALKINLNKEEIYQHTANED